MGFDSVEAALRENIKEFLASDLERYLADLEKKVDAIDVAEMRQEIECEEFLEGEMFWVDPEVLDKLGLLSTLLNREIALVERLRSQIRL
jgi:hypothetical protein